MLAAVIYPLLMRIADHIIIMSKTITGDHSSIGPHIMALYHLLYQFISLYRICRHGNNVLWIFSFFWFFLNIKGEHFLESKALVLCVTKNKCWNKYEYICYVKLEPNTQIYLSVDFIWILKNSNVQYINNLEKYHFTF